MLTLNDGRSELWQWDTGRTLAVDADCSQVHFSNKVFGRSIDVDVVDGTAIIPDILLQTDKDLNVWAFVGTAENGYTKISKTLTVNWRNKPADYVFTQTDQITLQTIQRQIGDLSDLTTEAKDTLVAAINEAARTGGGAGSMDLRVAGGYVQYSRDGGMTWTNLIAMEDLKGDPGAPGADGKSAYDYAEEAGYTGTETEFAARLAAEIPTVDRTLTQSGQAADAAVVGNRLSALSEEIANLQISGLTTAQVNALDGMFKVCAFIKDDISAEYNAFCTAFGIEAATITGISATYSGGDVAVGTAVTDLTGIVVTANYSDGSKRTVTGYTLSGTIAEGSNTITVTYDGMTTTFTVTGVAEDVTLSSISATYSGGDVAVGTAVTDLTGIVVTAHYSDGTSKTVTGYTLSGTIAEGSNTVTVTYQGKTTTFMVTGTAESGGGDGTEWTDGVPYVYTLVENEYVGVDNTGGDGIKTYAGWSRTTFLPCKGASKITVTYIDNTQNKLNSSYGVWYDADKKYITNFSQDSISNTVPTDACFVIFSQDHVIMTNIASITPHE